MNKQEAEKAMLVYEIMSLCNGMHIDIDYKNIEILDNHHLEVLKGKIELVKAGAATLGKA